MPEPLFIKRITSGQARSVMDERRPSGGEPLKPVTPEFRAELVRSLDAVVLQAGNLPAASPFFTMRLLLEENATAKTHRPDYLFQPGLAPIIGAGEPGELFVQGSPDALSVLKQTIASNTSKAVAKALSTIHAIKPVTKRDRLRAMSSEEVLRLAPVAHDAGRKLIQVQLFNYEYDEEE